MTPIGMKKPDQIEQALFKTRTVFHSD